MSKLIQLRTITIDDYISFLKWSKDQKFCTANGWDTNRNDEEVYDWLLRIVTNDTEDFVRLGIEHEGRLIGYGDLACITATSADVGIAIGERSLWGIGIGSCALPLLMKYGSKTFGIHSYTAETHDSNVRSRRMLENVGFTKKSAVGSEWYQGKKTGLIQYALDMNRHPSVLNIDDD